MRLSKNKTLNENEIVEFVLSMGEALHKYGAAAHHIEAALGGLAERYCESAEFFATPTSIMGSFQFREKWLSRIKRVRPGGIHLGNLAQADAIGDRVINGHIDIVTGTKLIRKIDQNSSAGSLQPLTALAFIMAATGFCGFFYGTWQDMTITAAISSLTFLLSAMIERKNIFEQMPQFLIAVIVAVLSYLGLYVFPLCNPERILLSGLIVLIPGLSITVGLSEIATNNWLAGTSRLVGAAAELGKIAFGAVLGSKIAQMLPGLPPQSYETTTQVMVLPESLLLIASAFAFSVLFGNLTRDYIWVIFAACAAYYSSKFGGEAFDRELGAFLGGAVVAAFSNGYARWFKRPALTVLLPGLIPMVPGTIGYRSVMALFHHDVNLTMQLGINLVIAAVALVAGLSLGNLLIHPRRSV